MHSTVSHGNNTYVFSVDKHREHYIFALNTSEPILRLAAPTTVLSHLIVGEERPVCWASRTLSQAERNYAQVEREALAVPSQHGYIVSML